MLRAARCATVNPDDKYTLRQGRIFITGTQALVRLPMTQQQQRERRAGRDTASACARPNGRTAKNLPGAQRAHSRWPHPERMRGYGHLRSRSMASARSRAQELLARSTPAA